MATFSRNVSGEDGAESAGPGTELQAEEGDCADEDGPVSPSERGCSNTADGSTAAKEDDDGEASDEDDEEEATTANPSPSAVSARLNPVALRDTGPPDRLVIPHFVIILKSRVYMNYNRI